jgi:hypothetical protein
VSNEARHKYQVSRHKTGRLQINDLKKYIPVKTGISVDIDSCLRGNAVPEFVRVPVYPETRSPSNPSIIYLFTYLTVFLNIKNK